MRITINGEKADITLERERTVGELLSALSAWLEETGYSISGITTDGTVHGLGTLDKLYDTELSLIETIDVRVSSWADLRREALTASLTALEASARTELREHLEKEWRDGAAAAHLRRTDAELYGTVAGAFVGDGELTAAAAAALRERLAELEEPLAALGVLSGLLEEAALRLEDIPLDLQTGKDGRAAESIALFTRATEKLFRLMPILALAGCSLEAGSVAELPFRTFMDELSAALRELLEAYETKDAVLVGDLAEYEIAPRLRALGAALTDLLRSAA